MKETVLITGANGLLANDVGKYLEKEFHVRYLTTKKKSVFGDTHFYWNIEDSYVDNNAIINCNHVIHVAGFPILNKWSTKNKRLMYDSRVKSTKLLFDAFRNINANPNTFICASAIGIYDQTVTEKVCEESPKGRNWLANLACDWEVAAEQFKAIGSRVVQMRISLIFSEKGGFLKYNLLSMKFGICAIIGRTNRKVNWMHIHDICRFIKTCIRNEYYQGPYNLACDELKEQGQFLKEIKKTIYPYALVIYVPMFIFSFLIGERSKIIDTNIFLDISKLQKHGFKCKINSLRELIEHLKQ